MHLAICDDHMADRKQMERLLGRESDRRLNTTGVLYVDSFGSKESILVTPMIYDAIFMDMTEDGCDAIELSHMLRADGTDVPIVFCCDKVDYRKSKNLPDNALFLDKPIVVSELTETIDHLLSIKNSKVKKTRIPQPDRHHLPDGGPNFLRLAEKQPSSLHSHCRRQRIHNRYVPCFVLRHFKQI